MLLSLQSRRYLAIAGLLFANVFSARADVVHVLPALGSLEGAAVFLPGGGVVGSSVSGNASIGGDVKTAVNRNIPLMANPIIDREQNAWGNDKSQDLVQYTSIVDNGDFSKHRPALASTSLQSSITLRGNQNITLSGGPGETVTLNLRNFSLRAQSTLTLQGTATTMFVINVSRQFSLSGSTRILFSDGIQWNRVVFNVQGRGAPVSLSGDSRFQGILNATQRTVRMSNHGVVWGEVVAARLTIRGAAQIILPPVLSP